MGTQWAGMGRSLMQLQYFRESILRSDAALKDTGLVVSSLLMDADEATFEDTVHAFVGLAAIQVEYGRRVWCRKPGESVDSIHKVLMSV